MCDLIGSGVRADKGFKEVHINKVVADLREFTGEDVTGTQVYNHFREWRQRWAKICKLRDLSGALWDALTCSISLDQDHYPGHIKVCQMY
jgi:methionine salvage enolase-phosphatase E1